MTVALYRRYRPDTFDQVVGQEHVTDLLKTALDTGRTTHAYIFSGPRGCGKTTSARIMARCLNCVEGPTSQPCGTCDSCVELATGGTGSLDVVEIDAASNRGVDDARDLRERATFAPSRDRYKIFILDEAHMVTKEGFNALLKLVEEPPDHVKFIFATTEPEKVIGTIRSRTHHYPFRLVAPNVLEPFLAEVAASEDVNVDEGVLPLVVQAGGGSVRDSLSLLDQLIAGSDEDGITHQRAIALLGYTDDALLDATMEALGNNDGAAVFQTVAEVTDAGQDPRRFTADLLQRVRDVLVCALAPGQAAEILPHVPADQLGRLQSQAQQWGTRLLSRRADLIDEALRDMVGATAPRLQLELLMGRLIVAATEQDSPAPPATPATTPARPVAAPPVPVAAAPAPAPRESAPKLAPESDPDPVERVALAAAAPAAPVAPPVTPSSPVPANATGQTSGQSLDLDGVLRQWPDVQRAAAELSRATGAYLEQTVPQRVEAQTIYATVPGPLAARLARGTTHHNNMLAAATRIFGANWQVVIGDGSDTGSGEKTTPAERRPPAAETPKPQTAPAQKAPAEPAATRAAVTTPAKQTSSDSSWGPVAIPGGSQDRAVPPAVVTATTPAPAAKTVPETMPPAHDRAGLIDQEPPDDLVPPEYDMVPPEQPEPSEPSEDDWDDVSPDDETIEAPPTAGVDTILKILGGKVIQNDSEGRY